MLIQSEIILHYLAIKKLKNIRNL